MQFNYMYETKALAEIDIDNIGDFCLRVINTNTNKQKFLCIKTRYGKSHILRYGPCDVELTPEEESRKIVDFEEHIVYTYDKIDFIEYKIENIINDFLNNQRFIIHQAEVVDEEFIKNNVKELFALWQQESQ